MAFYDNVFGVTAPDYLNGLLGQDKMDAIQQKANNTGLLNMALGYLVAPKHSNLGLGHILATSYMAGQEGAQNTYDNALRNYMVQDQITQMKKERDKQQRIENWQNAYGVNNADLVTPGGVAPSTAAVAPDANGQSTGPQFGLSYQQPTVTTNGKFDENKYLQAGVAAGAVSPIDMIKLGRGEHEYDYKDGVFFDKKGGGLMKVNGADKALDTNDIKGYQFAQTPAGGNFKGSFEDYLKIKPSVMFPIANGQLGVAQDNSSHAADNTAYNTRPPKPVKKVATLKDIADTAKASGKTTAEVTAALKAQGYVIDGSAK